MTKLSGQLNNLHRTNGISSAEILKFQNPANPENRKCCLSNLILIQYILLNLVWKWIPVPNISYYLHVPTVQIVQLKR